MQPIGTPPQSFRGGGPPAGFGSTPPQSFRGGGPPAGFGSTPPQPFRGGGPPAGFGSMPPPGPPSLPPGAIPQNSYPPAATATHGSSGCFGTKPKQDVRQHLSIEDLQRRLGAATVQNAGLQQQLNDMTGNSWDTYESKHFSAEAKAGLSNIDWRVPRVNYCKDPKYNAEVPREVFPQVIQAKRVDGTNLEGELGVQAIQEWGEKLKEYGLKPPPPEQVLRPGCPFLDVQKGYRREDDVWERALQIRPMDDAMRGDITQPLPRPILSPTDFENFHEGRYLKDDCPIA